MTGALNYQVVGLETKPPHTRTKSGKPNHHWTDEELGIIRRDYIGTRQSAREIALKLGVTMYAVVGRVYLLGLARQKRPDWAESEIKLLRRFIHRYSINKIAKKLHRSLNAVKIKATRLKMGMRARDDWFNKKEVCEILGVDHHKVQSWIDSGALVASYHNGIKPSQKGMAMWHIETEDLKKFIIKYSNELLGRNVDIQQIVWILIGEMMIYKELNHERE